MKPSLLAVVFMVSVASAAVEGSASADPRPGSRAPRPAPATPMRGRQDSGPRPDTSPRPDTVPSHPGGSHDRDRDRDRGERNVDLSVFCKFSSKQERQVKCQAGVLLRARAAEEGEVRLVEDRADFSSIPFEVECNKQTIFSGTARRFDDRESTRLQAVVGPYPSLVLPQGSLEPGHRKVKAELELRELELEGTCLIYEGRLL